jgi:hypothetical protein
VRTRRIALFIFAVLRYLQTVEEVAIPSMLRCKLGFGASISNLIVLSGVTYHGGAAVRHGLNWLKEFNSTINSVKMYSATLRPSMAEIDNSNGRLV